MRDRHFSMQCKLALCHHGQAACLRLPLIAPGSRFCLGHPPVAWDIQHSPLHTSCFTALQALSVVRLVLSGDGTSHCHLELLG